MSLSTDLFDYSLPVELIAQTPAARRDDARLLVVDRATRSWRHVHFRDLASFLRPEDRLFRNAATVIPARLHGARPTGGRVECLLLEEWDGPEIWRCLVRPGNKLPPGAIFAHPDGEFRAEIVAVEPDGSALVQFSTRGETILDVARRCGEVPLPPYIVRPDASHRDEDRVRYQTIYADPAFPVAVAAPTAGLHFTPELLARLDELGVRCFDLTLHVGLGTFRPISTPQVEDHPIHREIYEIPLATQEALFAPATGRRVAVGTTTVRAIEDFLARADAPLAQACLAEAGIFLYPPRNFGGVDALITNFHQPRSTLLCLVAAFLTPGSTDGIVWLKEIYAEAMALRYRFLSYGDAMLIL
jgi:S-adenosylmethionine:tRNA ribosyltransferase-isomerase